MEAKIATAEDSLPHFRGPAEMRAGQYVPSTFPGLISEAEEKIQKGEILKPEIRLNEYGKLLYPFWPYVIINFQLFGIVVVVIYEFYPDIVSTII